MDKTILFICTGNSCRSVMAEGLFRKMLKEAGKENIRLVSAGTAAPEGSMPPWEVDEIMRGENVDISSHRATRLTMDLIEEADLTLAMGERHRQVVLEMNPGAAGKVFLLKEFSPHPEKRSLDVPDPIGGSLSFYQEVLREIKSCLRELLKELERYL